MKNNHNNQLFFLWPGCKYTIQFLTETLIRQPRPDPNHINKSYTQAHRNNQTKSNGFLLVGFNTKIQRFTSPSQISLFTLEPKLEEQGEEKRLEK